MASDPQGNGGGQGKLVAAKAVVRRRNGEIAFRSGGEPFGARAIRMGFVSWEQVEKALAVQKKLKERGLHRLIGMLMIEMEMLDTAQLLSVLKTYESERQQEGGT